MTTLTRPQGSSLIDLAVSMDVSTGPDWLRDIRRAALDRFRELGLPTRKDEEWRFTSLKRLQQIEFVPLSDDRGGVTAEQAGSFDIPGLDCPRVVLVNGRPAAELSNLSAVPEGMTVLTLSAAIEKHGDLVREHLTRLAESESDPFTALNTAMLDDATVIVVDRGATIGTPVHVVHITTPGEPIATHPRTLIVSGESAECTVIEDYVSTGADTYLTNAVTELVVGDNGNVHHYFIDRESRAAFNVATLNVKQGRDSHFESHSALIGGTLVRNNVHPVLAGENCHSLLNGIYIGMGEQHLDNHMRVVHAEPHCDSRQYYRGILDDDARGVFSGRIVVARDAQKTDAVQSSQNLLLSPTAQANTKPQLEIYADDVKCTHGATIGQLDDDAIFYLRSRGLSEENARGMLIYSFARESLERMSLDPLREALTAIVLDRIPQTRRLRAYL
jgi:Fe-S cluster assembly protein SufD